MPLNHLSNWINELRQLCIKTSWSTLIQNVFLGERQLLSAGLLGSDQTHQIFRCSSDRNAAFLLTLTRGNKFQCKKKKFEKSEIDLASGQNSVRSNWPLIRLVCAGNCLWSDRARPKWPLIRQVSDHCPDKSALEAFSRSCNSSAPRTCVRSKMVWSELNSVWQPRPGHYRILLIIQTRGILYCVSLWEIMPKTFYSRLQGMTCDFSLILYQTVIERPGMTPN